MKRGVIRRLKRATNVSYKVYVRAEVEASVQPLGDTKLKDVIRSVLDDASEEAPVAHRGLAAEGRV